ncbi:hypothetical protein FGADI_13440, partial [Fusarium gaditjirri]
MTTGDAPGNIVFSSAVHLASSISWSLHQLATIPALRLPTNITAVPEYEIVSRLAPALPPIQVGVSFGEVDGMIAATNVSSPDKSIVGRQSTLRVMVVGDSISQGREGDFTWRYRIWQFFKQNGIDVEMVGPYKGTVPPDTPAAPPPPIIYGNPVPTSAPKTSGGYSEDVDEAFLANCNHFSAWQERLSFPQCHSTILTSNKTYYMFYSDAAGTLDSVNTFVANSRAANPNVKIAMADVPQRSFIRGRDDLVKNTEIYNKLLPGYISKWSTKQSPIHLVQLADNYTIAVYGAYSYDVTVSINGGANTYSPTTTSSNRWDSQWPLEGWTYTVSVRGRYGNYSVGPYTSKLSAKATPKLSDPPQNVNKKGSKFELVSNVTGSTCLDDFLLFPGTWNYEWCISAYNGNDESPQGPAKLAPSPVSGVDKDASAPTCPTAAAWCPAGASVSVPPGESGTLPPTRGVETIITNGMMLTITTLPASTDDDVTSTMTVVPPGVSLEGFTDFPISTNIWITTTGKYSSTTVVPVISSYPSYEPVIVWDTPEIPKVKFKWPKFPELPTFHLPCIKIFGIKISGQCPKPEGPAPINDGPPPRPRPSRSPPSDAGDDPCEFDMKSGLCDNGNYPIYDPSSNTISCDVPIGQLSPRVSQCQSHIDSKLDAVKDYLQGERSCCLASSKAKRQQSFGLFSSLINRGSGFSGFGLGKRAGDYCPAKNEDPRSPPAGKCYATYTCPDKLYPNVCGNAKSAINIRGATSILTHQTGSKLHDTSPWYKGRWKATSGRSQGGWKLDKCQVEEYPFGSGNPDRKASGNSVLRLIPGGGWEDGLENQLQGASLSRWIRTLVKRDNEFQKELRGTDPKVDGHGFVYCVEFDPGFTSYLPEDLANQKFCATPYGVEFTLVNDYKVRGVRTWDPWFDVPGTDHKKPELIEYNDPNGDVVVTNPSDDDYAVYAVLPPTYCRYPSPGQQKWDKTTHSWGLDSRFTSYGRRDDIASFQGCTDPPADTDDDDSDAERLSKRYDNQTQGMIQTEKRTHARDLMSRQGSSGGFHDQNIYQWLGCGGYDGDILEDADGDPCADDSNPCGDGAINLATTNGVPQSLDPLPASGVSTGAITSWPPHYTATDAPSYVPCSTHNADPDGGIARGYCVCSGSTFALSTDSNVTPANRCAYTSPLPKTTFSVSQLPTGPTASAPSPSPYVLVIYTREIEVAGHGGVTDTWWWDCRPFDKGDQSDSDICAIKYNPIAYSTAIGRASPAQYPTSLATFSLHGHSSCSYQGPNTATVGSVICDDGLTAKCTGAPEASQTSFVDRTDGDEVPNGLAR